jgi:hypothetical protein
MQLGSGPKESTMSIQEKSIQATPDQVILRSHLDELVKLAMGGPLGWHGGKLLANKSTTDVEVIGWLEKIHTHATIIKNAQEADIDALIAHSSVGRGLANIRDNGLDVELANLDAERALVLPGGCDCGREQWPHDRTSACLDHEIELREERKGKRPNVSRFSQEVSRHVPEVKGDPVMVACPLCGADMVWVEEVAPPGEADWCQGCRDAAVALINQDERDDEVIVDLGTQLRLVMGRSPAAELIKTWQSHVDAVVPDDETPSGDILDD